MIALVNSTPERIPADVIIEGQDKQLQKIDGINAGEVPRPVAVDEKV